LSLKQGNTFSQTYLVVKTIKCKRGISYAQLKPHYFSKLYGQQTKNVFSLKVRTY